MSTHTPDEIRTHVSHAYADRIKQILASPGQRVKVVSASDPCCTPSADSSCCGAPVGTDETLTNIKELYKGAALEDLPDTVTDVAFGCGNPTAIAALTPGQIVLDLGSGGGIDCFLAAKMVGPTGKVYGVDMTPDMISLARANSQKVGADNVEFRLGEIEHLPMASDSVDVIISNCVINLAPDKAQVFREAFRVLKPGGRLQVSDIVWTRPVPDEVREDMDSWADCIAGAMLESQYIDAIRSAGFVDVESNTTEYDDKGIASVAVVAIRSAE